MNKMNMAQRVDESDKCCYGWWQNRLTILLLTMIPTYIGMVGDEIDKYIHNWRWYRCIITTIGYEIGDQLESTRPKQNSLRQQWEKRPMTNRLKTNWQTGYVKSSKEKKTGSSHTKLEKWGECRWNDDGHTVRQENRQNLKFLLGKDYNVRILTNQDEYIMAIHCVRYSRWRKALKRDAELYLHALEDVYLSSWLWLILNLLWRTVLSIADFRSGIMANFSRFFLKNVLNWNRQDLVTSEWATNKPVISGCC